MLAVLRLMGVLYKKHELCEQAKTIPGTRNTLKVKTGPLLGMVLDHFHSEHLLSPIPYTHPTHHSS